MYDEIATSVSVEKKIGLLDWTHATQVEGIYSSKIIKTILKKNTKKNTKKNNQTKQNKTKSKPKQNK